MSTLLLAGAVAAGLALANQARADMFFSPRAQANQMKYVSHTGTSPKLAGADYLGAGAKAASLFPATVSSGAKGSPNLVSGDYLGAAARNPARDLRRADFEIAFGVGVTTATAAADGRP